MSDIIARRYKSKVSIEQINLLIDFLSQHRELAAGTYRTTEARHHSKILWTEAAKLLNGYKGGIRRPSHGWSKYWSDFKIKLKNKLIDLKRKQLGVIKKEISPMTKLEKRALHILGPSFEKKYIGDGEFEDPAPDLTAYVSNFKSKLKKIVSTINADASGTGGGPPQGSSLSEYDSRFLAILGPGFGQAAPGVRVDPFPNQDPLRPEIKQESVLLTNGYHRENNENDRLSESEDENSPQQSDDEVEEDQSSEEPTVKNLYPQWLVEVEKKRAEAELRRAKAEEMKAEVAVKNAEAAFVQSQAIRKLAEAADRQADAVLRIAMLLESRRSRDDILNL